MEYHPIKAEEGGVVILLVTTCYGNQNKLWLDGPLGSGMISLLILLSVCQMILIMLVWRIWYWIN